MTSLNLVLQSDDVLKIEFKLVMHLYRRNVYTAKREFT